MSVIAIVNRKGGVGKSTIATHVAAYLAGQGNEVMLGDVDRQQSSRLWLSLRHPDRATIHGWTIDDRNFARPPAGMKHVVLDTPGGFQGVGLMKVAMYADAILIPATTSVFDRTAAAESIKELRTFPRVANGKCVLACVGMRIDGRTRHAEVLAQWAAEQGVPYLGSIKAAQAYNKCLEQGLALFDFPLNKVEPYLAEWAPVTDWLDAIVSPRQAANPGPTEAHVSPVISKAEPLPVQAALAGTVPAFLKR